MAYGNRTVGTNRFRTGSRWRAVVSSPFTIVALVVALAFMSRAAFGIYEKDKSSSTRLDQAQADLIKAQAEQAVLSVRIQYLSTDSGVEAALRQKYRAVKDGESVAVVMGATGSTGFAPSAATTSPKGWIWTFLQFFGL